MKLQQELFQILTHSCETDVILELTEVRWTCSAADICKWTTVGALKILSSEALADVTEGSFRPLQQSRSAGDCKRKEQGLSEPQRLEYVSFHYLAVRLPASHHPSSEPFLAVTRADSPSRRPEGSSNLITSIWALILMMLQRDFLLILGSSSKNSLLLETVFFLLGLGGIDVHDPHSLSRSSQDLYLFIPMVATKSFEIFVSWCFWWWKRKKDEGDECGVYESLWLSWLDRTTRWFDPAINHLPAQELQGLVSISTWPFFVFYK